MIAIRLLLCSICFAFITSTVIGQSVGINNDSSLPNEFSMLDINSNEKGLLIPRMSSSERNTLSTMLGNTETAMMVYDTEEGQFYFWKEGAFHRIDLSTRIVDIDQDTEIRVEETPDDDIIRFYTEGNETWRIRDDRLESVNEHGNLAVGDSALYSNTPAVGTNFNGTENTAIGQNALAGNSIGFYNTALGFGSLSQNRTGATNTAIGRRALGANTTGFGNVAIGSSAMLSSEAGENNIAVGNNALWLSTEGNYNLALGNRSLNRNRGNRNIAAGQDALYWNSDGIGNISIGVATLRNNRSRDGNIAIGDSALYNYNGTFGFGQVAIGEKSQYSVTTGYNNVTLGQRTLRLNRTGHSNSALGAFALQYSTDDYNTAFGAYSLGLATQGEENTAVGGFALYGNTSRNRRTAIGYSANSLGNNGNNTGLGNDADCTAAHQVRIGNDAVTSIGGYANWTNISDGNFKKNVEENVPGLEFIQALRPVTYQLDIDRVHGFFMREYNEDKRKRYSEPTASGTMIRSGFIAQEVEASAAEIGYDFSGVDAPKNRKDYYGLRYAAFVVPLVKAVQEQQQIIDQQAEALQDSLSKISALESRLARLEKLSSMANNQ